MRIKQLFLALVVLSNYALADELLTNFDFEAGLTGWSSYFANAADYCTAKTFVWGTDIYFYLVNGGTKHWDAQLVQKNLTVRKGHSYTLKIGGSVAGANHQIWFGIQHNGGAYTTYKELTATLTTTYQEFGITWDDTTIDDATIQAYIDVGTAPGTVSIAWASIWESNLTSAFINQAGFHPASTKQASVLGPIATPIEVRAPNGTVVGTVSAQAPKYWLPSLQYAATVDFSQLSAEGAYALWYAGSKISRDFTIGAAAGTDLVKSLLKFYYYQRASMAISAPYAGAWPRNAGHPDNSVLVHSSAGNGSFPSPKGWYDAGDYGKYIVSAGITVWTLLALYEDFPKLFDTLNVHIPESGNGVPDILNEVRYELDWMLTMQAADGGVYHKLTTEQFCGFIMPSADKAPRYAYMKTTAASLDFAAVMAKASRVYRSFDVAFANSCLSASRKAYAWAEANPAVYYVQPAGTNTGEYGDHKVTDEKTLALALLAAETGENQYVTALASQTIDPIEVPWWGEMEAPAAMEIVGNPSKYSPAVFAAAKKAIKDRAAALLAVSQNAGYGNSMQKSDFHWSSNGAAGNQGLVLLYGYYLTNNKDYLTAAQSALDYLTGRNPLDVCFITGSGSRSPLHPHHRISEADGVALPVPGNLVGGPNPWDTDGCPSYKDTTKPALSWTDASQCAYSCNEGAIDINAAATYCAGALQAIYSGSIPAPMQPARTPGSSVLDDCEGGTNRNALGLLWYEFDDSIDGGNSKIVGAVKGPPHGYIINTAPTAGEGINGSAGYKMPYIMGTIPCPNPPGAGYNYVGIGTMLAADNSVIDLTGTTAITFWAKAVPPVSVSVQVITSDVANYDFHRIVLAIDPYWRQYTVPLFEGNGGLNQQGWGAKVPFNPAHVQKIEWLVHTDQKPPAAGALNLDEVLIHDFKLPSDSLDITIRGDTVINTLSDRFFGQNYWQWPKTWQNLTIGTEKLISDLNISFLRLGGTNADVDYPDTLSDSVLSDFNTYCGAVHAEPYLQLKLAKFTNTTDRCTDASRMLTYFKSLYPVTYVSIGNEPDIYSSLTAIIPEYNVPYLKDYSCNDYCTDFNAMATVIKTKYPDVKVVGPEFSWNQSWIPEFVSKCKDNVDVISLHFYPADSSKCTYDMARHNMTAMEDFFKSTRSLIDQNSGGKLIPMIISETNITYVGDPTYPLKSASPSTFNAALWMADFVGVASAQKNLMAIMPWSIREWWTLGFIDDQKKPRHVYDVYRLFTKNIKRTVIHKEAANAYVRIYGYKDSLNNVSLFAVNWDTVNSYKAKFNFLNILNDSSFRFTIPAHSLTCLTFSSDFANKNIVVCNGSHPPELISPADESKNITLVPTVVWSASAGATKYRLQLSTKATFSTITLDDTTLMGTSRVIDPLSDSTTYYWRVCAKNGSGYWGPWSLPWRFTTIPPLPQTPSLLAPANGATCVTTSSALQWNSAAGALTYHVQVSKSSSFDTITNQDSTLAVASMAPGGFANATAYFWRVRAKNGSGVSAWSTTFTLTTLSALPATLALSSPSDGSTDVVLSPALQWSASADAATYHLQLSTSAAFDSIKLDDPALGVTSRVAGPLIPGKTYYWRVMAKNNCGLSGPWSSVWSFTTSLLPATPSPLAPANGATCVTTSPTLQWNSTAGALTYHVQVSKSSSFDTIAIQDSTLTVVSMAPGGLANATAYYWRVRAKNGSGVSAWSTVFNFTTITLPPAAPAPASPSDGSTDVVLSPALQWSASADAAAYHIQMAQTSSFNGSMILDSTLTATSATLFALSTPATYYWRVCAKNNCGVAGSWSATWSFSTKVFPMSTGWNMISLNIHPSDSSAGAVFGGSKNLVLVKNNAGQTYWPEYGINTIGSVRTGEGYKAYVKSPDTIRTSGSMAVSASSPIALPLGWNMMAYLPQNETPIATALAGIAGKFTLVKDNAGQTYWPDYSINTIGTMKPGQGYKIYMTSATVLTYP